MILSRSNICPNCSGPHSNSCYILYEEGEHCYSCGYHKSTICDYKPKKEIVTQKNIIIPKYTLNPPNFSLETRKWLYQYYLDDLSIYASNIAYCPPQHGKTESLMYYILENGNLVDYQRRFFPKSEGFFSTATLKKNVCVFGNRGQKTIVLVEDYISAVRVGQICSCICLWGTNLPEAVKNYLLLSINCVIIWLDADEAGQNAARKIMLQLYNAYYKYIYKDSPFKPWNDVKIPCITTEKQPKELSPQEIYNTLRGYL